MGATKLAAVKTIVSKVNFKVTCKGKKLINKITKGSLFIFILIFILLPMSPLRWSLISMISISIFILSMISINVIIKMVTNINIYIHIVYD